MDGEAALQLAVFYPFGIFGNDEAVDAVLYIPVHKSGEVVNRIIDAMVGDAPLWEIVGADFGRPVTCGDHRLATRGNIVDILLMLLVVNERTQTGESTFLILRLVARLGTFDVDF